MFLIDVTNGKSYDVCLIPALPYTPIITRTIGLLSYIYAVV